MRRTLSAALLAAAAAVLPAGAQEQPHAFRGATLIPIAGPPVANGVLVVQGGRITAVGGPETAIPAGAVVHDVAGKTIMPGLVDTHSHIGRGDGGDRANPMQPSIRLLDALDARDESIQKAQAGGITTVNVMPGSGQLMSGQTVYLKLRDGSALYDLLAICRDVTREICGGMKMANGTNPRGEPPHPGTRSRAAAIVRERFVRAQEYREKIRTAGAADRVSPRDLELEALAEVLDGRRMVHFHTHRADDILTAVRLSQEFGFRVVLHHVSEAYRVAGEIARARVPASVIILDSPGGKLESLGFSNENGRALEQAGVLTAFHTDDGITDSRFFLRSAGFGVRAGMSRERALEAMTLAGARMLGMEDRVGSLERGKDADFIVLSGDPLSVYSLVEQTWVEGSKVFDRANPADRMFAVGGPDVFDGATTHTHDGEEGH